METAAEIVAAHRAGRATPEETIRRTLRRIAEHADPAVFISLASEDDLVTAARAAAAHPELPLCGVPVAVKDNVDVAGLPTTAACPAFAYSPPRDAACVARLKAAGAIVVGKTNLDQFATGLVGVRSPYGVPRNPRNAALIPGGSSSGSAVAVAAGLVPLALGTDTAGSGRVPAGLNNIVGLKPSLGLLSAAGVVPACRSLDCVSVFALTVDDAWAALAAMRGPDPDDARSRDFPASQLAAFPAALRIGIPAGADLHFFGDAEAERSFAAAIAAIEALGAAVVAVDFAPMLEAARLLYDGPWVAERTAAVGDFIAAHPDAAHPVTRAIVMRGVEARTVDAFKAFYRLDALRAQTRAILAGVDALMVPTAPRAYTVADVLADPFALNSNLGTYTNFVNLMDLCGLSVPATLADNGTPYGVTLLAPAGRDADLASIGRVFHHATGLPRGASTQALPDLARVPSARGDEIAIAVVGAHLSGLALNHELRALGARFVQATATSADYRLFALPGGGVARPGLLRVKDGAGCSIEAEVWALPPAGFGRFVAGIPSPLSIGTLRLSDGTAVKGFLVEAEATTGARDISAFGGWRGYLAAGQ